MSTEIEQAREIQLFLERFKQDQSLQQEYLQDPSRFLTETVPQREYGLEVQAIESRLSAQARTEPDKAVPGPEPTSTHSELLMALPGGAAVTFEPTMGKWSVVTGYYLVLNEKATTDVVNGLTAAGTLAGLIAAANPELVSKTAAAIIAGAVVLEVLAIKTMDGGNGVYFYVNPFLLQTVTLLGPEGLVGSWVGPFGN